MKETGGKDGKFVFVRMREYNKDVSIYKVQGTKIINMYLYILTSYIPACSAFYRIFGHKFGFGVECRKVSEVRDHDLRVVSEVFI